MAVWRGKHSTAFYNINKYHFDQTGLVMGGRALGQFFCHKFSTLIVVDFLDHKYLQEIALRIVYWQCGRVITLAYLEAKIFRNGQ